MTPERTRELLENCAKACGIELQWPLDGRVGAYPANEWWKDAKEWNPLESSADEAEMESLLRLTVEWFDTWVTISKGLIAVEEDFADHPTPQLARMMAGCRAAEAVYLERGK